MKQAEVTALLHRFNEQQASNVHPATKRAWVKALRSGKFVQIPSALHGEDNERCCLGVFLDVQRVPKRDWKYASCLSRCNLLNGISYEVEAALITLNDGNGATFEQIANAIEEVL